MADGLELKKGQEIPKKENAEARPELASKKEVRESAPESTDVQKEKAEKPQELPTRAPVAQAPVQVIQKDKILVSIEHILSDNLADAYLALPPEKRSAFKKRGEEIALKVKVMVDQGNIHIRKVLGWIRDWLRMIPGVNAFFLEQEAKIKADKLLEYYKKQTGQ